jgi:hypothetical protein
MTQIRTDQKRLHPCQSVSSVAAFTACVGLLAPQSLAQAQPDPLRGPALTERAPRASLVSYDMQSRLRDLETSPERAAIGLMNLSAEETARVEQIFADRAAVIDAFVAENILLLSQLDTAGKAQDKLGVAMLLAEGLEKLWPELKRPPLRERIVGALPTEDAARFRALIAEYRRAWRAQARADAGKKGDHPPAWALALAETATSLGQEIQRSAESQTAAGTIGADYLLAGIQLTSDQRQMVAEMKLEMLGRTGMKPDEKDQQQLVLAIIAHLPEPDREKVIRKIVNR